MHARLCLISPRTLYPYLALAPPTTAVMLTVDQQVHCACPPICLFSSQGPAMLSVRRLTALTELRLTGLANLAGDIPVAMLASCMPPDLMVLQLASEHVSWPLPTWPPLTRML